VGARNNARSLDLRSSSATYRESNMRAPIWSPNDHSTIFKLVCDWLAKIAGATYTRR